MKIKLLILAMYFLLCASLWCAPIITNLTASQRTDATKKVDIFFNVSNNVPMTISLLASNDNGATWNLTCAAITGDVGTNISPGNGKHIVWDVLIEHPNISGSAFKLKVIADDGFIQTVPANFVLVQGGTFNNGTSNVTVSSFYIDKYELTQSAYQYVTSINPAIGEGYAVGTDYPVYNVSWFDAIKYCNQRSISEGLTPCYSYGLFGTSVSSWPLNWEDNYSDPVNGLSVNTQQTGYRLPTVNEWRFAAKGGNLTPASNYPAYSGSNNIDEVAWYHPNSGNNLHTVGTKSPNELGIFDMSGNMWEWCWDLWPSWYGGTYRLCQGGAWDCNYYHCWITRDDGAPPSGHGDTTGFRLCRTAQ